MKGTFTFSSARGEDHSALVVRRGVEPPHWLLGRPGSDLPHVALHLAVAARISRRPDFRQHSHCARFEILGETGVDDLLVGIKLRGPRTPRPISDSPPSSPHFAVRRAKPLFLSGCESHPTIVAPAGRRGAGEGDSHPLHGLLLSLVVLGCMEGPPNTSSKAFQRHWTSSCWSTCGQTNRPAAPADPFGEQLVSSHPKSRK